MSTLDFDAIAENISPKQLATAIGARASRSPGDFHCPGSGHENGDKRPSLSINRENGRTVACCHRCDLSGSPVQVAADVWGLSPGDAAQRLAAELGIAPLATRSTGTGLGEEIATYPYSDESGAVLYDVVRFFPKDFRHRLPDGTWKLGDTRRVLYRLPAVVAGVAADSLVMVCEGEKDADALADRGFISTTCAGGAGKWRSEYSETLRGARVVILPDNDQPGREHGQAVELYWEGFETAPSLSSYRQLLSGASSDAGSWSERCLVTTQGLGWPTCAQVTTSAGHMSSLVPPQHSSRSSCMRATSRAPGRWPPTMGATAGRG